MAVRWHVVVVLIVNTFTSLYGQFSSISLNSLGVSSEFSKRHFRYLAPEMWNSLLLEIRLSLHFDGHFPGGPGSAGTRMSPFWILLELRMVEVVVTTGAISHAKLQSNHHHQHPVILQAGCPSCHPTNSVKALKENPWNKTVSK